MGIIVPSLLHGGDIASYLRVVILFRTEYRNAHDGYINSAIAYVNVSTLVIISEDRAASV